MHNWDTLIHEENVWHLLLTTKSMHSIKLIHTHKKKENTTQRTLH